MACVCMDEVPCECKGSNHVSIGNTRRNRDALKVLCTPRSECSWGSAKVPPRGNKVEPRSRGLNPFSGNVPPGGKMAECFLIRIGHCTFTSRSHTSLRVSRKGYKKREERREERGKRERRERRNVLVGRDRFQRGASWWSMRNLYPLHGPADRAPCLPPKCHPAERWRNSGRGA